jgi:hypothetical protein
MEVGQGPNWGCSAKGKKYINLLIFEDRSARAGLLWPYATAKNQCINFTIMLREG